MKKAFAVFVYGTYERFVPYYVYTIEKTYPDTDVLVFYNQTLSPKVANYLKRKPVVKLYENFMSEEKWLDDMKLRGAIKQCLRHLIKGDFFNAYDYIYFGDVDILIMKETQSLFEFHKNQAKKSGMPFSNSVRILPEGGLSNNLTGLHFVIVKEYYEKIDPIIDKILLDESFKDVMFQNTTRNEHLIYNMCMHAFDFNAQRISENLHPMHGFHLGVLRHVDEPKPNEFEISLIDKTEFYKQYYEHVKDIELIWLLKNIECIECFRLFYFLKLPMPLGVHFKYRFIYKLKKLRRRIKLRMRIEYDKIRKYFTK